SSTWIANSLDEDRLAAATRTLAPAQSALATCYDVEPIGFAPAGGSCVSLMTLQYASAWDGIDPSDDARTKHVYAETLLDLMEVIAPSVREVIEEVDVATPLTMSHYLGQPGGAIYGFEQDATESWLFRNAEGEPVPGLHLAGAWTGMGGFQPTLEGGARVARRMLRDAARPRGATA
ncbi:MAG: NAD(P)/FAD-dependent oxidoreductase, partial [Ilumatobacteraceae bacterium]